MDSTLPSSERRLRAALRGAVQGVGFRPFIHRLATELKLRGWVSNSPQGVALELEGPEDALRTFVQRVPAEAPPASYIHGFEVTWLDPAGLQGFEIRPSDTQGAASAWVLPDLATCPDCAREILDPADRRYFYPFTNCTRCGPRFSIIEKLPYDRAHTSMREFTMCPACAGEYANPADRRFHAQPNACPVCGPTLSLWDAAGKPCADGTSREILTAAVNILQAGQVLALKGLGGFHLAVLAGHDAAVRKLRQAKHREAKPFAVMAASLENAREFCEITAAEERLLRSPEAPIVLLRRLPGDRIAPSVAPGIPNLGVMLPYTPLHLLLMHLLGEPIVATSGNLSDEPICIDEHEALARLGGIADAFLVHNRRIVRHVDDSIVRLVLDREMVLRRARGYAPLPVTVPGLPEDSSVLAVGAHLKNTVAVSRGPQVFLSQHLGDLETPQAHEAFRQVSADLPALLQVRPQLIAADAHPDYLSTQHARDLAADGPELISVQHHLAHVLGCMGENELTGPVLGVAWDGTGYGLDQTIWGGEFFCVRSLGWERLAHLRPFRLPGGEAAVKEPRRCALGLLHEYVDGDWARLDARGRQWLEGFNAAELSVLQTILRKHVNSPVTTSAGRLFDAVAALAGFPGRAQFEGQAAMWLEFALPENSPELGAYPMDLQSRERPWSLDWAPLLRGIISDLAAGTAPGVISAKFHNGLAVGIVQVAQRLGESRLVLSGGCFQNRYLLERVVALATHAGLHTYWPQRVPPNDGGISLGQIIAALRQKQ